MLETIAQQFSMALTNSPVIAFGLAFTGGLFTGFSPCVLPFFPAVIGYVAKNTEGSKAAGKEGFLLSLLFVLGFSSTFAVIGAFASYVGGMFALTNRTWYFIVGAVLVVVGLHFMQVLRLRLALPVKLTADSVKLKGGLGAFVLGILLGLILSPCATPVVAVILTYVMSKGNAYLGGALLFVYSLAHGLPLLAAGTSTGFITKISFLQRRRELIEAASGSFLCCLGFIFSGRLKDNCQRYWYLLAWTWLHARTLNFAYIGN
ncbi:MAG: cytochrome c biogenesis protein CcdA [Actinobacteria bacterium]|nr:cytochrome c biogenesis protein CcdA [Actinomycetota bacterium]